MIAKGAGACFEEMEKAKIVADCHDDFVFVVQFLCDRHILSAFDEDVVTRDTFDRVAHTKSHHPNTKE